MVETTWMVRYPRLVEISYDQGGEFFSHRFKNSLIEQEYRINNNPDSTGIPQVNATIERIHQLLGNFIQAYNPHDTYVDDYDPWMIIPGAAALAVIFTYHHTKGKSPC